MFMGGFPHPECAINEHVFRMRTAGELSEASLYFWLDRPDVTQRLIDLNSNAAQPGISQAKLNTLPVLLPDSGLEGRFSEIANELLRLLFNLARSNRNLQVTRDLLLPRLVSGELGVPDPDIDNSGLTA
jgi:type I restriction enzyme, S subunit